MSFETPSPLMQSLSIAAGGALGSNARYWLGVFVQRHLGTGFPSGTLAVNVIGSLFAGIAAAEFVRTEPAPWLRLFVVVGLLGGFTTFSAFAYESVALVQRGKIGIGALNVIANIGFSLTAVCLGFYLARLMRN